MTTPWKPCAGNHDWQPLDRWPGRYKCRACFVTGYHKLVSGDALVGSAGLRGPQHTHVIPYKCPSCGNDTTLKDRECPACRAEVPAPVRQPKWLRLTEADEVYRNPEGKRIARILRKDKLWDVFDAQGQKVAAGLPRREARATAEGLWRPPA